MQSKHSPPPPPAPHAQGRRRKKNFNDDDEYVEQQSKSGTNAPPPTYDGSKEPGVFDDYKIKAKLWLKTSDLDDNMKGARLLQGLSGQAFDQMKHLAEDENWLDAEDGGQQLIILMNSDRHFGKLSNEDLAQELQKLLFGRMAEINQAIKDREDDLASLRAKFDKQVRKLKKMEIEFPSQILGFLSLKKWSADSNKDASSTTIKGLANDLVQKVMTMENGSLELENVSMAIHELQLKMKGGTSGSNAAASTWLAESPGDRESPSGDGADSHLSESLPKRCRMPCFWCHREVLAADARASPCGLGPFHYKCAWDHRYKCTTTACSTPGGHWREDAICTKRSGPDGHANYYMELEDDDMDEGTETLIEDQVADE